VHKFSLGVTVGGLARGTCNGNAAFIFGLILFAETALNDLM
jgi:hypothetical protein